MIYGRKSLESGRSNATERRALSGACGRQVRRGSLYTKDRHGEAMLAA